MRNKWILMGDTRVAKERRRLLPKLRISAIEDESEEKYRQSGRQDQVCIVG